MKDAVEHNLATYNRIADDWDKDHEDDTWWREGVDEFEKRLPEGASILDVGCGSGKKTAYFRSHGFSADGVDLSPKFVDIARKKCPEGNFTVADMLDLSGVAKEYDAVFAQASLLHIHPDDTKRALQELVSKLRTGGLLYVSVKEQRPDEEKWVKVTESDYGYDYSRFFQYFTMDELKELFKVSGLDIVYEHTVMGGRNWLQLVGVKVAR